MTSLTYLPVVCGLAVHLVYNRYEPRSSIAHLSLLLIFPLLATLTLSLSNHLLRLYSYLVFLATVSLSVVTYRVSPFHPLSRYPGPLIARISKLWMLHIVHSGRRHIYLKQLHDKYGPYVRIGPNEVSFCDVNAIQPVLGTDGMPKGPKWESRMLPNPEIPPILLALRSPAEHTARRRIWARAFTAGAIKEYQDSIVKRANQLVGVLSNEASRDATVDVSKWIGCFTFDFMGDMVFGGGFELMSETKDHEFKHLMHKNLQVGTHIEQLPWASRLAFNLPNITKDMKRFKAGAIGRAKARYDSKTDRRDLFFHLIDESDNLPTDRKPSLGQITTDSSFAISAGADTTSSVLTSCIYCLAKNPSDLKHLREEVDALFSDGDDESVLFDAQKLVDMKYLNAVINETMRLFPPVPSGSERAPLPGTGSKIFGEHVIPEGNSVNIPTYALHRDPRYFAPLPDTFWPERWIIAEENSNFSDGSAPGVSPEKNTLLETEEGDKAPKRKITHNMSAFIPFSYGPRNCVGMRLAMLEMRIVLSLLVRKFDFAPAPGVDDLDKYEESMKDWFAISVGNLNVKLTPRGV